MADITPRPLVLAFFSTEPLEEPTDSVTVTHTDNRIDDDVLTVNHGDASVVRRGNQLLLVVDDVAISGPDATNYVVSVTYEEVLRTFALPPSPQNSSLLTPQQLLIQSLSATGLAGNALGLGFTATLLLVASGAGFLVTARMRRRETSR
jgi:hypothetical protein